MVKTWKRVEPTKIDTISYRTVVTKQFLLPDGRVETFGTLSAQGEIDVATIAITKSGEVLIFRQFRPGPEFVMDELLGGGARRGHDIEKEAIREMEEESGYTPGKMEFIGKLCNNAYSNNWFYYYLATECVTNDTGQKLDHNEKHGELLKISIDQLIKNAKAGKMADTGAILLAYDMLLKLKEKYKK